jgi:hypothetical protein
MHGTLEQPAVLHYYGGLFDVLRPGTYVVCAVTGRHIPLDALRYWSVERQEPYADGDAALGAAQRHQGRL